MNSIWLAAKPSKAHNTLEDTLEDVDVDLSEPAPTRGRLFMIWRRQLKQ